MPTFAAALSEHPLATQATGEVAGAVLEQLDGDRPDLVVCFASPQHVGAFEDITRALRKVLEPAVLVGATAGAVIGGSREVEDEAAVSVFAAVWPHADLVPVRLCAEATDDGTAITGWPEAGAMSSALLLLADPFSFPTDGFLARLAHAGGLPVVGGLASAASGSGGNRLAVDGEVVASGAVGVLIGGGVEVGSLVSQGCRPAGRPFTVTRAEGSLVLELGGRPALERLQDLLAAAPDEERELLRRGLHVGIVVDEHRAEFGPGDFLVRNLLGADPRSGALLVGEQVEVGQTLQFHVRDADAADHDLRGVLEDADADAALLFTCNGRGRRLFGTPDHDARAVAASLGPVPLAGAFCAGEIGPVGDRSFLHGFTASLLLFRSPERVVGAPNSGT